MRIFENVIGQEDVVEGLRKAARSGRIHHAYLFIGPPSVGKRTIALSFACVLNCQNGGCGECETCQRIMRGVDQDVLFIQPESNFFTIGQVRKVIQESALKPWSLPYKVIILDDVQQMTPQAANAFLRALEEPPSFQVLYILLTTDHESVLETVRSRCQPVHFHRLSDDQMVGFLSRSSRYSPDAAQEFVRMAGRTYDSPLQVAGDRERLKVRNEILTVLSKIPSTTGAGLFELAAHLDTTIAHAVEAKGEALKQEGQLVLENIKDKALHARVKARIEEQRKNEIRRSSRMFAGDLFNVTLSWFFDLCQLGESSESTVINNDHSLELGRSLKSYSIDRSMRVIEKVRRLAPFINYNVNRRLLTEMLLLKISEVK